MLEEIIEIRRDLQKFPKKAIKNIRRGIILSKTEGI